MIINQNTIANLFIAYSAAFKEGFALASPIWSQVAMRIPSSTTSNQYPWMGVCSSLREWLGDRVVKDVGMHQFTITNRKFELTQDVKRESIEDDQYGMFEPLMRCMGESAALHPDELIFGLIANGLVELAYDGVPFFSTLHPVDPAAGVAGNVQSNLDSGGAGPYWYLADLSKSVRPLIWQVRRDYDFRILNDLSSERVFMTDDFLFGVDARVNAGFGLWQQMYASNQALTETNVETAVNAMLALVSDEGQPLNYMPTHIIVPSVLWFDALRLLQPTLATGESNIHQNRFQVIMSKHLPIV